MRWFENALRGTLVLSLVFAAVPAPSAFSQDATAIDAALDELIKVDPAALVTRLAELKGASAAQDQEAAALRAQADALAAKAATMEQQVDSLMKSVEALAKTFMAAPPAPSAEAAPVMEASAPAEAEMGAPLTNYEDHVKPIFEARCASCHNPDKRKSGLALTSYALLTEGGSSGPVITPGDADGSRLIRLVTKAEEPFMPPSGDPLTPEQIEVIRKWLADGAPANASTKPVKTAKMEEAGAGQVFVAATFAGTPPMPEAALAAPLPLPTRGVVARAIDTSPRAPLLAVGGNRQIMLYNIESNTLLGALPFPEGDIYTLSFSVNGEVLLAGGGEEGHSGLAVAWNIRTGERLGVFGEAYDTVLAADISPDHRTIALGGPNRKVRTYDAATGAEMYTLDAHADWIYAVKFTPDGEVLATADRGGNLFLWQAANGRKVEQLSGHTGAINALAYTPDSSMLASAGADGTVQVWDTWKYNRIRTFKAHNAPVLNLDVSADSKIVTTSSDRHTKLFAIDGTEIKDFGEMPDWGYQACFDSAAKTVLAGSWTGEVYVWNLESGEKLASLATDPVATPAK
ncbi:MAG: hypothetical protein HYV27_15920 [Candidatus Hydrogenedentes bacterium]|nr:hypothetical protein [Candidatus Hydrogenedentota bacterium]